MHRRLSAVVSKPVVNVAEERRRSAATIWPAQLTAKVVEQWCRETREVEVAKSALGYRQAKSEGRRSHLVDTVLRDLAALQQCTTARKITKVDASSFDNVLKLALSWRLPISDRAKRLVYEWTDRTYCLLLQNHAFLAEWHMVDKLAHRFRAKKGSLTINAYHAILRGCCHPAARGDRHEKEALGYLKGMAREAQRTATSFFLVLRSCHTFGSAQKVLGYLLASPCRVAAEHFTEVLACAAYQRLHARDVHKIVSLAMESVPPGGLQNDLQFWLTAFEAYERCQASVPTDLTPTRAAAECFLSFMPSHYRLSPSGPAGSSNYANGTRVAYTFPVLPSRAQQALNNTSPSIPYPPRISDPDLVFPLPDEPSIARTSTAPTSTSSHPPCASDHNLELLNTRKLAQQTVHGTMAIQNPGLAFPFPQEPSARAAHAPTDALHPPRASDHKLELSNTRVPVTARARQTVHGTVAIQNSPHVVGPARPIPAATGGDPAAKPTPASSYEVTKPHSLKLHTALLRVLATHRAPFRDVAALHQKITATFHAGGAAHPAHQHKVEAAYWLVKAARRAAADKEDPAYSLAAAAFWRAMRSDRGPREAAAGKSGREEAFPDRRPAQGRAAASGPSARSSPTEGGDRPGEDEQAAGGDRVNGRTAGPHVSLVDRARYGALLCEEMAGAAAAVGDVAFLAAMRDDLRCAVPELLLRGAAANAGRPMPAVAGGGPRGQQLLPSAPSAEEFLRLQRELLDA
ncbi:hypothetical protein DIPPA_21419 [Diplonema papillatum]|nr:hypothetical protein DIPPA_21419 [Diplonema papillatum]